ncbi:hypothetical protein C8Q69DRAFT_440793 [Paecilomyces variotii]|uniref:GPI anchored protein n=1 Tax=Byssochlamys spectabilis TaxID=264951 RepID=A0A443I6P2_BYSSP|nr:hypothetical protein C8Q69DRAFT_440793 [Paecilomyces variotii]RWQ99722.1 hypothetical protein C8Q69DRAFT_440793 [Paecilomyces variotii]
MAAKTFVTSLAMLGLASAQSSVISVFIPDTDPQPLVASIIGNDAAATTYYLTCPVGTDGSDCGMGPGMTLISGPKTAAWMLKEPEEDLLLTLSTVTSYGGVFCSMGGTTSAICTSSMSGTGANFPGVSTETLAASDIHLLPVTVTAGSTTPVSASASATGAASASTAASVAPTVASQASSPQASASRTSGGSSATSTKASGTADSTTSTGAAVPLMSANAKVMVGLAVVGAGVVAVM